MDFSLPGRLLGASVIQKWGYSDNRHTLTMSELLADIIRICFPAGCHDAVARPP